jgi:putative tricarboxylic transport membrane protein
VLGYAFKHYNVPLTPLIIALVLGGGAEEAFRQALIISAGNPAVFVKSGISCAFLVVSVLILMMPTITRKLMPPSEQAA